MRRFTISPWNYNYLFTNIYQHLRSLLKEMNSDHAANILGHKNSKFPSGTIVFKQRSSGASLRLGQLIPRMAEQPMCRFEEWWNFLGAYRPEVSITFWVENWTKRKKKVSIWIFYFQPRDYTKGAREKSAILGIKQPWPYCHGASISTKSKSWLVPTPWQ